MVGAHSPVAASVGREEQTCATSNSPSGPLTFGQAIDSTRLAEGLSLEARASRLGVSRAYLCDVEKDVDR